MEDGCSTHGGHHKRIQNFRGETRIERTLRMSINGVNIKMHFKGVKWIYLAQDKYQYPGHVNMLLRLRVS